MSDVRDVDALVGACESSVPSGRGRLLERGGRPDIAEMHLSDGANWLVRNAASTIPRSKESQHIHSHRSR